MFQSYCDLEAVDTKSLKLKWQNPRSNSGPLALALQVRVSTTAALESMFGFYLGRQVSLRIPRLRFFYCLESSKNADYNEISFTFTSLMSKRYRSIYLERSSWGRIKLTRNDANPLATEMSQSGQCLAAKSVFM